MLWLGCRGVRLAMMRFLLLLCLLARSVECSRRFLLLHNTGSSAGAFRNRGGLGLVGAASSAYHDGGPHAWQIGGMEWDLGIEDATEWGEWWTSEATDDKAKAAVVAAIAAVEEEIRASSYDGIVGFSEGAIVAAIVAARAAVREEGSCADSLKFAVAIGASVPTHFEDLLQKLDESTSSLLPTMHCVSMGDAESGQKLAAYFGPSAVVQIHAAGHKEMPPKDALQAVIAFADKAVPEGSKFR